MEKQKAHYVPGVCNIGPQEITKRMLVGWIGLIVGAVVWFILEQYHINPAWKYLVFFPAMLSAFGFIQGLTHFCAMFGLKGLFNLDKQVGKTDSVSQAEYRKKDRAKAWTIIVEAGVIGLVVAAIAYYF